MSNTTKMLYITHTNYIELLRKNKIKLLVKNLVKWKCKYRISLNKRNLCCNTPQFLSTKEMRFSFTAILMHSLEFVMQKAIFKASYKILITAIFRT